VAWAGDGCEPVVVKLEHADVGRRQRHRLDVDGEMATPLAERVDGLFALARHPADAHRRRRCLEPAPERLHQNQIADFARGHGEVALGIARIERLGRTEQAFHAGKNDVHGGSEFLRLRRGHEPLPGAHEQLVGEDFSKLGKGMADGRRASP
jgi:hypothetical protein